MIPKEPSKLHEAFILLNRIHHRFHRLAKIDFREFSALVNIARKEKQPNAGITMGQLAKLYNISLPAASNLIKKIEADGFVIRQTDKADRRVVRVRLTEEGKREIERAAEYGAGIGKKIEEKFGEENIDKLIALINDLSDAVTDVIKEEKETQ